MTRWLNERDEARDAGDRLAALMNKARQPAVLLAVRGWPSLAAFDLGQIIDAYCAETGWLGPACSWVKGNK